jgi:hypothetical protein
MPEAMLRSSTPTGTIETTPKAFPLAGVNLFTNQQLIDAFFDAANKLHNGDYQGLLARAGLDINQLAADRGGRYGGAPLAQLSTLSAAEIEHIHQGLLRQLQRHSKPGKINVPDGANLRAGPGRDHPVLVSLPFGDEVSVLGEEGEWLLVSAAEESGWVFATLVDRNASSGGAGTATATFSGSLAPPAPLTLPAGADAYVTAAAKTWNEYGGLILAECERLGFDPAVAVAILGVESSGRAFEGSRMVIRFENHIFLRYWGEAHRDLFDRHFTPSPNGSEHRWRPDPNGEWLPCHTNQATEWQVFEFARSLDERAALYSISMGAAQIMGFNHTGIGYGTPQAMFDAFQADVRHQLLALFRFIEVNRLQDAVRDADFVAFARSYNGHGQEGIYAPRLQRFHDAYRQLAEANRRATGRLPRPGVPPQFAGDPELLAVWSKHVAASLANNQVLFQRVLQGFLRPYWTTVWMYRILFALGVMSFLLAAGLAIFSGRTMSVITFGGLSAITVLGYFFNRPLQSLEQNLQFLTWLGIVYNTYWTRLTLLNDEQTVHKDIDHLTNETISRIKALVAEHEKRSKERLELRPPWRRES